MKTKRAKPPVRRRSRARAVVAVDEPAWWTQRRSRIHQRGLFAARDIPRGTRIIEYRGHKITKAVGWRRAYNWIAKADRINRGAVYIFELNARYDIDGNVPWNIARFINHSCEPNCEPDVGRGQIWIVARRKIRAGEELTYDYGYDLDHWADHPCRCGSPGCVGYIVGREHRTKLRRLIAGHGHAANR